MDTRKSAVNLQPDERDAFLEALLKLKAREAANVPPGTSIYDQFVALHGAVMAVVTPGVPAPINFAHWSIGFLPWHRQYIRLFELALQEEVAGVTLPYWDWPNHIDVVAELFTPDFLSSLRLGGPLPITDGVLRRQIPTNERPAWWPAGIQGFDVHQNLEEGLGRHLRRGSAQSSWPPQPSRIAMLESLNIPVDGRNALWAFWLVLEQGHNQITPWTHNAGHNFIGGHMALGFSPNDPIFWLHHANVDRIWAKWQANRLADAAGTTHADHWPAPDETSPFTGQQAPLGHRLNDAMWPWVGNAQGYQSVSASQAVLNRLHDYSGDPSATVADMLDISAMDYAYSDP